MASESSRSTESSSPPPSPSPPGSPNESYQGAPSLERLVQHLVVSKSSLTSASHVRRAVEIVNESRAMLEDMAVINAKNLTARRLVNDENDLLYEMRDCVLSVADSTSEEFGATISSLDIANDRLQRTLAELRNTVVDPALKSSGRNLRSIVEELHESHGSDLEESPRTDENDDAAGRKGSGQTTLHDFVDEASHTELQTSLRDLIDSYNEARADFDGDIVRLDASIETIKQLPMEPVETATFPSKRPTIYDEPPPSIPELFQDIQEHAATMATLLNSLVTHYDLCVTALKHTEGGGQAAKQAIQAAELLKNASDPEESLYQKTVAEPISDEDRDSMLRVLEKDAPEVEDVVLDLRERNAEQELQYQQLCAHHARIQTTHDRLAKTFELLREMHDIHLPAHRYACQAFYLRWRTLRDSFAARTSALNAMNATYENFLTGYSKLMKEVERRVVANRQMEQVAEKAGRELRRMQEADAHAREDFLEDVGSWLPEEIWPGAKEEGLRWEVVRTDGGRGP